LDNFSISIDKKKEVCNIVGGAEKTGASTLDYIEGLGIFVDDYVPDADPSVF